MVLLSASQLRDLFWKLKMLERVDKILLNMPVSHLHTRARVRRSQLRRLRFDERGLIQESSKHCPQDAKSNAVFAELVVCEADRHLERCEYEEAYCLLDRILPFGPN